MVLSVLKLLLASVLVYSVCAQSRGDEPDYREYAKMARYLVHKNNWTMMATVSTLPAISGFPIADIVSIADSVEGEKSTGQIYMILTDLHFPEQDLLVNNKLTLLFSMEQYKKCSDAMEPTCARLTITGKLQKIPGGTEEHEFGMNAMLSRHPIVKKWILYPYHEFYLAKVEVQYIMLQDFYGRPNNVAVEDYFAAEPEELVAPRKTYRRMGRRFFQRDGPSMRRGNM